MPFQINTNVNALNAHAQSTFTQMSMRASLEKLSSGLRVNKAADDASGMAIADSLRNQANALGQAIRNANDAVGIVQIADKAMDEQIKILDTIKTKATQAAQDGQTATTRQAIQADINRLIESLDNIASSTSFNGQALLSGAFSNKEFQIGAYSNITIKASIGPTSSDKIGNIRLETIGNFNAGGSAASVSLTFNNVDGVNDYTLESVKISHSAGTGIGVLADTINKNSDKLQARASWSLQITGSMPVSGGVVTNLVINDITIGTLSSIGANDSDGRLIAAINNIKDRTGVEATIDENGRLNLRSLDGRAIKISAGVNSSLGGISSGYYVGRLTLTRLDSRDIDITGFAPAFGTNVVQTNVNLRSVRGSFNMTVACAAGAFANDKIASYWADNDGIGAGVTSLKGAMITMDIADTAMKMLDKIRSDLGSVQNQLVSTINNITITQVNVKSAESQIREVDFAAESAEFSKLNILAQSGTFAMSQSNAIQQNIVRLLQ